MSYWIHRRGPLGDAGLRTYHFDRFPYTVMYEEDMVGGPRVFAIAHQSREPGHLGRSLMSLTTWWLRRLKHPDEDATR